jgi:hypothetical protein
MTVERLRVKLDVVEAIFANLGLHGMHLPKDDVPSTASFIVHRSGGPMKVCK